MDINRLNTMMDLRGVGPGELATRAGVSREYVWRLRAGKQDNVSADVLSRMADCLGVSVDYLLGRDDGKLLPAELVPVVQYLTQQSPERRRELTRSIATLLGIDITVSVLPWQAYAEAEERVIAELKRRISATDVPEVRARLEELLRLLEDGLSVEDLRREIDRQNPDRSTALGARERGHVSVRAE